jgi:hypothetical protein
VRLRRTPVRAERGEQHEHLPLADGRAGDARCARAPTRSRGNYGSTESLPTGGSWPGAQAASSKVRETRACRAGPRGLACPRASPWADACRPFGASVTKDPSSAHRVVSRFPSMSASALWPVL